MPFKDVEAQRAYDRVVETLRNRGLVEAIEKYLKPSLTLMA